MNASEAPLDGPWLAFVGPPGSGKSAALAERAGRAARAGRRVLAVRVFSSEPGARQATFGEVAFEVLGALRPERTYEAIEEVRAAHVFESVGAGLFSLDWDEFLSAEIDPEITGLRTPERFSSAAFRLIRKLRGALVSPDDFRTACLRGATEFYARPPNFAGADLLMGTGLKYRDSLRVDPAALRAQYERELDLTKILHKLYVSYVESLVRAGCLTATDAVYEAVLELGRNKQVVAPLPYDFAVVDDAQDLTAGEIGLLKALFGPTMEGVTLAGDPEQATRTFAGARGDALLRGATRVERFEPAHDVPAAIAAAARRLLDPAAPQVHGAPDGVELYRGSDARDEARFVASEIAGLLRQGVAPERIAVIARDLDCAHAYVDALLARDIPLDVAGRGNLLEYRAIGDALGALWALADPFRHDWLLRCLEAPWLALSDATIATLCAEPRTPQAPLFEMELPEPDAERRRWDARRDFRLARNVLRGENDAELEPESCERLGAFRAALARWEALERELDAAELAATILAETVLATLDGGARGRFERNLVRRLLDGIGAFVRRDPAATLEDWLLYAERVVDADGDLLSISARDPDAVQLLDVETAKGRTFDYVFVVDLRAGAFPRYYAPEAFLFTPRLGLIPKENVGPLARAARTAKFTYALYALKLRERYHLEERRAAYCAASRARIRLYLSASGYPTRGAGAPELFEELKTALGGAHENRMKVP